MSIQQIFELGKRSLLTYQSAINTASGNISNINNENYSRRRTDFSGISAGFNGLGLSLDDAIRIRQRFAEHQIWQENQYLGQYQSTNLTLTQVENTFAEGTDAGLSTVLTNFWNSWNDLANDPENEYARNFVKDKARILTNTFQRIYTDLKGFQQQIVPEAEAEIREINQYASKLKKLNISLQTSENPDLYDERDRLLNELSQKLNVQVKEHDSGQVSVYVDGFLLVSPESYNQLQLERGGTEDNPVLNVKLQNSRRTININSGKLGGLLDTHNNYIPEYLQKLDELAKNIASEVNKLHRSGENLSGTTNIDFFASDVKGVADFKINNAILNDTSLIATRLPGEAEGSGALAQSIADLQFASIMSEGTAAEFYNTMMTNLGNAVQETTYLEESQKLIVENLQNHRDAVAGVSLDEEMTRLVQYQQAYEASAKIINTVDEMVQTVLTLT